MNVSLTLNINIHFDPATKEAKVTVHQPTPTTNPSLSETQTVDVWDHKPKTANKPAEHGAHEPQKDPDRISLDVQDQQNQLNQLKVPEAYGEPVTIVPLKVWREDIASLWRNFAISFRDAEPAERGTLMQNLAGNHNHWKVLQHIVAYGGLQLSLVYTLQFDEKQAEELANLMVQISHASLPDLARTLDYSSAWRRTCAEFYSVQHQG